MVPDMAAHFPDDDMLAEYVSGAASPGVSLMMACHLTFAPASRKLVAELERLGGALLSDEAGETLSDSALSQVLDRIDAADGSAAAAEDERPRLLDTGPLPRPLIDALGVGFGEIPWGFRLPGVSEYELDGFGDEEVSILRAKPGSAIPQHTHTGREMTLVMAGALQDGGDIFRAGDIAINDEDDDHRPRIIGDEICYCLTVMNGGLHFTGTFSRALNLFNR